MRRPRRFPPFTMALIIINVAIFFVEMGLEKRTSFPWDWYGALSLNGLRHGYYWQLLTFQFLHGGWVHLLLNCWMIFVFGPALEATLGKGWFAALYLLSGIAGGALQVGAGMLSHLRFDHPVVGASAGVFGLIAAFTFLFPDARMTLLLFFVIPVQMTANRMLTLATVITVVGIVTTARISPLRNSFLDLIFGTNVAHAAHLGGLIGGLIIVRAFLRRYRHSEH
jgi:membrane associated rhomboid family serine protease